MLLAARFDSRIKSGVNALYSHVRCSLSPVDPLVFLSLSQSAQIVISPHTLASEPDRWLSVPRLKVGTSFEDVG